MNTHRTAAVFPGQGTQRHGMGRDFYDRFDMARRVYEESSDALGWDVAGLCFGDDPKLHLTEFAQPCILTTEMAMFRTLKAHFGFSPDMFGGHSLGEYTALVASGALALRDAVKIVHVRGQLMQNACPEGVGGMAAVIADDLSESDLQPVIHDLNVDIANINSPNQIVLSGGLDGLEEAGKRLSTESENQAGMRMVPLAVSAAFHSRFMAVIMESFDRILRCFSGCFDFSRARNVTSNFRGGFHSGDADTVLDDLVRQIFSPVRWRDNMAALSGQAGTVVEIGPGRPLRAFFGAQGIDCVSLTSVGSVERFFAVKG